MLRVCWGQYEVAAINPHVNLSERGQAYEYVQVGELCGGWVGGGRDCILQLSLSQFGEEEGIMGVNVWKSCRLVDLDV